MMFDIDSSSQEVKEVAGATKQSDTNTENINAGIMIDEKNRF